MRCEWAKANPEHSADCFEKVVAKVGLPYEGALWACEEGFNEFQGNPQCASWVGGGTNGVRCQLRIGHEGKHRVGATRWS